MREVVSLAVRVLAGVGIVIGLPTWFLISTMNTGLAEAKYLAREHKLCGDANCDDGAAKVFEVTKAEFGVGELRARYCLGLGYYSGAKVRRGGWIISLFGQFVALPCHFEKTDTVK